MAFLCAVLLPVRLPVPGRGDPDDHVRRDHHRAVLLPAVLGGLPLVVRPPVSPLVLFQISLYVEIVGDSAAWKHHFE